MKTYRKTATVQAKLFEEGDEDGFVHEDGFLGAMEDARYGIKPKTVPYISTLENQYHRGEFGKHYVCVGIEGERWLVEKNIFEATYKEVTDEDISAYEEGWKDGYDEGLYDGLYK